MEIQIKLGAKAMGCSALEKNEGSNPDAAKISDHQQSWGYEDGPWKGPGPPLLVVADF